MNYAVIKTGGKQYRVEPGEIFDIDRLADEKGAKIVFDQVLLRVDRDKVVVGQPFVSGVGVQAKVVDHVRGDKIRVSKFKAKSRYRRVMGFRAELTRIEIEKIEEKTVNRKSAKKGASK